MEPIEFGRRLVIHIGTHKTGTTSFQASLRHNQGRLLDQEVKPILEPAIRRGVRTGKLRPNAVTKAHLFLRPEVHTAGRSIGGIPKLSEQQAVTLRDRFRHRLVTDEATTLVMSSELFCLLRTDQEAQLLRSCLDECGRAVETHVVFREEQDWRASLQNQLSKMPKFHRELDAVDERHRLGGEWYFDKHAIRGFWTDFNLHEVSYEDHVDSVTALYRSMRIDPAGLTQGNRLNLR